MAKNLVDAKIAIEKLSIESDLVTDKCVSLFGRLPHTIGDFTSDIEAFLLNKNQTTLTLSLFGALETHFIKEQNKVSVKQNVTPDSNLGKRPLPSSSASSFITPTMSDSKFPKVPATGSSVPDSTEKSLASSFDKVVGTTYAQRTTHGDTVVSLNTPLGLRGPFEPSKSKPLGARVAITVSEEDFSNIGGRYRYMFTTLDERARNLDKHLMALQEDMRSLACLEDGVLQPVGVPSQDTVWVCGRICCEAAEGRINKSSVVLEGSRKESAGRRVHLDLSEIHASYSLFPGQIVLVEGVNSSGRKMIARRIIEGVAKPMLKSDPATLLKYHHSTEYQGGSALSVVTAAGPFTTSDNLDYQPLNDLLLKVLETKPDVLILIGPFVDVSQPLLSSGQVVLKNEEDNSSHLASYEMVFVEKVVRDCIGGLFNSEDDFGGPIPTHIVIIPSLLDAHHEFVFPQPPFGDRDRVETSFFNEPLGVLNIPFSKDGEPKKRVHLMPNPCMFRVNEVLFGVSSNDVLFSLSSDEVNQNIEGNRVVRLGAHLLQQQSFSPQFPVQTNTLSQFDVRQSRHWEFKQNPDILILPSRLQPLAKDVHGSLIVNPGALAKGIGGGTYAELAIHPMKESELRDAVVGGKPSVEHNIFARTSLNIVKI